MGLEKLECGGRIGFECGLEGFRVSHAVEDFEMGEQGDGGETERELAGKLGGEPDEAEGYTPEDEVGRAKGVGETHN